MKILITGGTGMVGLALIEVLKANQIAYNVLTRGQTNVAAHLYHWDIEKKEIDAKAFDEVTHLVLLAGANVSEGRWTKKRKDAILKSRVDGINFLFEQINSNGLNLIQVVSASAIGIYGNTGNKKVDESSALGNDYLALVCKAWENAALQFRNELKISVTILRIGVVISEDSGAWFKLKKLAKLRLLSPLGDGEQMVSWIHIYDLSHIIMFAINKKLNETINAVAPAPVSNKKLTQEIYSKVNKSSFLPNVPTWALKLAMGEMSQILLDSQYVNCDKLTNLGYNFKFKFLSKI